MVHARVTPLRFFFFFFFLYDLVNPPNPTVVSYPQIKTHSSSPALPPFVCLLCVYMLWPRHHITEEGRAETASWDSQQIPLRAKDPCQSAAPAPDPPSASANVFADWGRQPFNGLFHVGEERRPGLTLALLGQTGGRRSQVAGVPGKTNLLLLLLLVN